MKAAAAIPSARTNRQDPGAHAGTDISVRVFSRRDVLPATGLTLVGVLLISVALVVAFPNAAMGARRLVVGGQERPWAESGSMAGVNATAMAGWIQPDFIDSSVNILTKMKGWGGTIVDANIKSSIGYSRDWIAELTDSNRGTGWPAGTEGAGVELQIDLGAVVGINRIVLVSIADKRYGESTSEPVNKSAVGPLEEDITFDSEDYIRGYEVLVNDGSPQTSIEGRPLYESLLKDPENQSPTVDTRFRTRYVRFIKIVNTSRHEFFFPSVEIYGEGFVTSASYVSREIDLGGPASFGRFLFHANIDPNSSVIVRTKSGITPESNLYYKKTAVGLTEERVPSRADYDRLTTAAQKGRIEEDASSWSPWSAPYKVGGGEMLSPGNRRYVQFRIDLLSQAFTERVMVDSVSLEYSSPPVAHQLLGEISPTSVAAGVGTGFTYFLKSIISGNDTGFDALAISMPGKATVEGLTIDGVPAGSYTSESTQDLLTVRFPQQAVRRNAALELEFTCPVFTYGTLFLGKAFDSRTSELPQSITPGDASARSQSDRLWVATTLGGDVFGGARISPEAITPNGDGANDLAVISYSLLRLNQPARVRITVRDASGATVRNVYSSWDASGIYEATWDGSDDNNRVVSPGIYMCRLSVETDAGESIFTDTIAVVY